MGGFLEPPYTNRGVVTENGLSALIDWVQVTFKETPFEVIVKDVLKFPMNFLTHNSVGLFRYAGKYEFGDIKLLVPPADYPDMGHHLYLSGKGCRQLEIYLQTQNRTWREFFATCFAYGGKFTRVDIAIDDRNTYFDIAGLNSKIEMGECVSRFRKYAYYNAGQFEGERAGRTLNFGSRSSNVFVVFYEKNYERAGAVGTTAEDIGLWNRYEIRVKDKAANKCVREIVKSDNLEYVARCVLRNYIRFVCRSETMQQRDLWPVWPPWERFLSDAVKLQLSMSPAPKSLEDKMNWVATYVAPTLKIIQQADDNLGTEYLSMMIQDAELQPKHKVILEDYLTQCASGNVVPKVVFNTDRDRFWEGIKQLEKKEKNEERK